MLYYAIDNPHGMVLGNKFFNGGREKPILLLVVSLEISVHSIDYQYLKTISDQFLSK